MTEPASNTAAADMLRGFIAANVVKPRQATYGTLTVTVNRVPMEDLADFVFDDPKGADALMGLDEQGNDVDILRSLIKNARPLVGKMIATSFGYRDDPAFEELAAGLVSVSDDLVMEMLVDVCGVTMPRGFAPFFAALINLMATMQGPEASSSQSQSVTKPAGKSTTRSSSSSSKRRR